MKPIPFNKPHLHGDELNYIRDAVDSGKISGDGIYSKKCHDFFERRYRFRKTLLTTSCTDALEMAALLYSISSNDEVIVPSYTFVSTANAFALRGAKIIFADSSGLNPNVTAESIEKHITNKTKLIVVVHYAGVACEMSSILELANSYNIPVIEDCAQAIESFYNGHALGSIGSIGTFSFHETKNINSGEGGLIAINDEGLINRAEVIREKGTNRSSFFRGEVDKYNWVDIGSSFLPSELNAAFLYAQLNAIDSIQNRRIDIWNAYNERLSQTVTKYGINTPSIPTWATNNAHMYYLTCSDLSQRTKLISSMKEMGVHATFHYQALHMSPFYLKKAQYKKLEHSEFYTDTILRLPLYYDLNDSEIDYICDAITKTLK